MNEINPKIIQNWIDTDKKLYDTLVRLQSNITPIKEQAEISFHELSELYNVPKTPNDIDNKNKENINQSSVYEQLGILKYLEPNSDLRGHVLSAVFLVKNKLTIDINTVINKKFGKEIPSGFGIGYKGNHTDVELVFVREGESWYDKGCKLFTKMG